MRRLALVLLFASSLHAQAPSTFKEGVLAFEKGEWAKAEALMRQTIAVNPRESEGTVSIAGSWFETYVPQYFLARALAKQGKCEEALQFFAESERQGVTPNIPDFARHLRTRGGCRPAAKEQKQSRVVTEVEVPFAEEAEPNGANSSGASPGGAPASGAPSAGSPSSGAPSSGAPASSRPLRRPPGGPDQQHAGPPPAADVTSVETRARLTTGIRAYLEGQYEVAVRVLSGAPFADRKAAGEAALFRAAARDALYRMGGEQDAALRAAVETDLRIYRELGPTRKPDPRVFPPRFIAMAER
jgi:pentatricopeptide repeat protein